MIFYNPAADVAVISQLSGEGCSPIVVIPAIVTFRPLTQQGGRE